MMGEEYGNAFGGIVSVPRNANGMDSLEHDMDDAENVVEWKLTESENASLASTYHDINDRVGAIIDYCEDETIPLESLSGAFDVVSTNLSMAKDDVLLSALGKLRDALELALECGTCVWLFL